MQRTEKTKVLIVEDHRLSRKFFRETLYAYGYDTLTAEDSEQALGLAREYRPDLILMDIQLPTGPGLETTRHLKRDATLRSIPVVAVSAHAMCGDRTRILESGCDGYLSKPVSIHTLVETVEDFVQPPGQ